jgi:hypothetical protein
MRDLNKGRTGEGFDKLDKFGAIQEIGDGTDRLGAIAEKQIKAVRAGRSSLIMRQHMASSGAGQWLV